MKKGKSSDVLLIGIITIIAIVFTFNSCSISIDKKMYLASDTPSVEVLDKDGNSINLIRGSEVVDKNTKETVNDVNLEKIVVDGNVYFVDENNLVENLKDVVLEKDMFVFRDCVVYEDEQTSTIKSELSNGERLTILDYDYLKEDGTVNRYMFDGGYVNGKYLTTNEELLNYHHALNDRDDNPYGGGNPKELDYFPNEKPIFEDNVMPVVCKAIYLNAGVLSNIDKYIEHAKESDVNTFVIDIRESSVVTYKSEVMNKYSISTYERGIYSLDEFKEIVNKCKDAGIYLVGRITVFKDNNLMIDHPEFAIQELDGTPYLYENANWPSPYVRDVWQYNVELAKEVISELGFNEVQFDYLRFPERLKKNKDGSLAVDLHNENGESKAKAIQKFLMYASDEIHSVHGYLSVDIFGETANDYVTAYGQYMPAISNVVDVISPMPYPDHFEAHTYGIKEVVWTVPYELLSKWGERVVKQQSLIETPAKVRCYIQGFNANKKPAVEYDNEKLDDQIKALKDQNIYDGFIIWLSSSNLEKYQTFTEAIKNN